MFDRSRLRMAYWFACSMGSILILFAFTVYHRQVKDRMREFDANVYAQTKKIASQTSYQQQDNSWQVNTENVPLLDREVFSTELNLKCIRWYDFRKRLLQFIGNCTSSQSSVIPGWQTLEYECSYGDTISQKNLRTLTLPLKYDLSLVGYVQVAVSIDSLEDSLRRSRLFFSLGVPITLGLTGIVGWFLAGLAMQPVRHSYEQLQRFTADASHELRAPVAAILSNAQVGLLAPPEDREQPRQRLANIVTQSKLMSGLIANLLFLARHEGKLNPKDITKTDIVELLNYLAKQYQTRSIEKNLQFNLNLPTTSLKVCSDRDLLQQAIRNLLDNAIKYTEKGSITLELMVKPRRLFIKIKDTGIGIPASDLPHIFDRFYRVDKARTRQTGSFGLGLAIAWGGVNGYTAITSKRTDYC